MSAPAPAPAAQTTAPAKPAKTMYEWTSQDHDKKCKLHGLKPEQIKAATAAAKDPKDAPKCSNEAGCCPPDLVINASARTLILGAEAKAPQDSKRIDVGDRRQGEYYLTVMNTGYHTGLVRVRDLPIERLRVLEKERQVRTGERPQDWILEARARSQRGEGPPVLSDAATARSEFQKAAGIFPE